MTQATSSRLCRLRINQRSVVILLLSSLATFLVMSTVQDHWHQQNLIISESTTFSKITIPRMVVFITPTYRRPTQIAELTRLSQTLMLVPRLLWIVVEDGNKTRKSITELLQRTGIAFKYMHSWVPNEGNSTKVKPGKGFAGRQKAMDWIRENLQNERGVVYFGDDDNSYDVRLFDEIRKTRRISVFPVGLINKFGISSPIVNLTTGRVVAFKDWIGGRKFGVDMAGFAVDLQFFLNRKAKMENRIGYLEDTFIKSLNVSIDQLEPLANNCSLVLVWHTKSLASRFPDAKDLKENEKNGTNLPELWDSVLDLD